MLNSHKKLEFRQSLECLSEILPKYCSDLNIRESEDDDTFILMIQWESSIQMRRALRTEEFLILSGAIKSLAKNTRIWLDNKDIGNDISRLMTL